MNRFQIKKHSTKIEYYAIHIIQKGIRYDNIKREIQRSQMCIRIIDSATIGQIINLLNHEFIKDSKIRIMPDTHAGAGCVIGTTMTITYKIVPNLVGVDIGCGMEKMLLKDKRIEMPVLDKVVREYVPSGFNTRESPHKYMDEIDIESLYCFKEINYSRATLSMGTLGGGNHFIELDKDDEGNFYLVVHSGSRNLGKQIAEYYQESAVR